MEMRDLAGAGGCGGGLGEGGGFGGGGGRDVGGGLDEGGGFGVSGLENGFNKMTRLLALADLDRITAFGLLAEESRGTRLLVTTKSKKRKQLRANESESEPERVAVQPERSQPYQAFQSGGPLGGATGITITPEGLRTRQREATDLGRSPGKEPTDEKLPAARHGHTRVGLYGTTFGSFAADGVYPTGVPARESVQAALLAMHLSLQKAQLGATEGLVELREENVRLKRDLEAVQAEKNLSTIQMNQYLSERNAVLRSVDFQKAELEKRGEEVKERQRIVARLTKEAGEKELELRMNSERALRVEQERAQLWETIEK
ncbi:keratin, type I cytoskeletal 10-like [Pistacia vera]|uniref:keratin, type I cytoskeletal 10-like n=1 Tax=Pistacia vera TaxID=55513 RepID=UPI00126319FE|nr:keratin, type I cytoskeletal 10-like [Pistacia vera]